MPRVAECGHAFCLLCALRTLEASAVCPICTAAFYRGSLRPFRFEITRQPISGESWRFVLLRRKGAAWLELASSATSSASSKLTQEGEPGWRFARRVLADPEAELDRLHADARALERLSDDPLALLELKVLQESFCKPLGIEKPEASSGDDVLVFYQSEDGQLMFPEPALTKRLLAEAGKWADLPPELTLRIRSCRSETLSEELRRRHRFLAHLPVGVAVFLDGEVVPNTDATSKQLPVASPGADSWQKSSWSSSWDWHSNGNWQNSRNSGWKPEPWSGRSGRRGRGRGTSSWNARSCWQSGGEATWNQSAERPEEPSTLRDVVAQPCTEFSGEPSAAASARDAWSDSD